jgi:hypothetical protein
LRQLRACQSTVYRVVLCAESQSDIKRWLLLAPLRGGTGGEPARAGEILRHVLAEFAAGLPKSVPMKRSFVTSGALMRMVRLQKELLRLQHQHVEPRSAAFIDQIAALFPPEVVDYYSEP